MLITPGNFERYFPHDRLINVPHKEMFATIAVHGLIIFAAQVFFFNFLAIISIVVLMIEAFNVYTLIYRMWTKAGYSPKIFAAGGTVLFFIGAVLSMPLREYIAGILLLR